MVFDRTRLVWMAGLAAVVAGASALVPGWSAEVGVRLTGSSASPCATVEGRPWCDRSLPAERRAVLLVGAMTEDEKLESLAGDDLVGPLKAADDGRFRAGTVHGVSRLGVPELHLVDAGALGVKQGPSTALASGLSLAATFDTRAAERAAAIAADEAAHRGNDVMLGPAVDIMRTPRGGRTFEAYGEDPFLSSRLAATWVKTVQKAGLMAEVKHFPANNQETERFTVNAVIGQRALREIYLAPFEAAVRQARAASVMCAYNLVNGSPSCSNQPLLKRVLREEWGHQGMVVSDWIRGAKETTGSVTSGLDLEMPVAALYSPVLIRHALSEGKVTWADLDGLLAHRLRVMFEYGMFDRAPRANDNRIDFAGHAKAAQRLSEQGITLLKNRGGVLPLKPGTRIAVIGKPAAQFRSGIGSAYVKPISTITPLRGLTTRAGAGNVRYADGTNLAAAVKAARAAKAAVVFVADSRAEDADVPCLTLRCGDPKLGDQDALVRAVAAANPRTVVVMQTGGPVLTPWAGTAPGIVETWYPGGHGGAAIARVLYGDVDPGGRLPVSFPTREADAPAAGGKSQYPGDGGVATYSEGVFVGYRHYDAKKITPAFPFGHGLSYTTFKLSGLTVSRNQAQVTVTNTGRRRGNAVPQLYLGLPGTADIPQPPRQLKGFTTVSLAPGASTRVTFPLDTRAFSSWDEATGTWKTASGCVNVMAGASSRDIKLSRKLCL